MDEERKLCKITSAEFGAMPDRPYLFGLFLGFGGDSWGIADGGMYSINIEYHSDEKVRDALLDRLRKLATILREAKVDYVSELIGIPVEVTIEDNRFKSFRILTEVL